MLRSGLILGVSGPAAILSLLVHPMIRQAADHHVAPPAISVAAAPVLESPAALAVPRPVSIVISPIHVASVSKSDARVAQKPSQTGTPVGDKAQAKPRRTMRDGCEGAISSLAGPEARRMVPGRCIA